MGQSTSQTTTTAAGVTYEDWYGNDQADEQARAGAEKHGYTNGHTCAIEQEDAEKHKNIKGVKTGAIGKPSILPEQLGHDINICGDYEYCLGCGRSTKAKHIQTAKP
eukprot:12058282-Heterocapsa_arctica.AAC.1